MKKTLLSVILLTLLLILSSCNDSADDNTALTTTDSFFDTDAVVSSADETTNIGTDSVTDEATLPSVHTPQTRNGWKLEGVPAYIGGLLDNTMYNAGRGLKVSSDAVYLQNITATSDVNFTNFINELELCGYVKEYENTIDKNKYVSYIKDDVRVYAYYLPGLKTATVIRDTVSCPIDEFCFETDGDVILYAYGFKGTGQLLLWHLSDNSWIVNDGGNNTINVDDLFSFMCKKSNIDKNGSEKLKISLWYVTHMHEDHTLGFVKFINKYHSRVDIERAMWNVPEQSVISTSNTKKTQSSIDNMLTLYYKDIKYLRPHTGMEINIGSVLFRVLMTQEDNTKNFYTKDYTDFNSTCTVCMTEFSGVRMFLPGDMKNGSLDNFVCKIYSLETYASPVIQVAHHGYNSMKAWYNLTLPHTEYAIFENTKSEGLSKGSGQTVYDSVGADKCFFTDKTWAVYSKDGKIIIEEDI